VEQKIKLLEYIRNFVKNDPHTDPYQFADDICRQLGVEMFEPDPQLDQKMSWIQLRELSANPLFTIGGHSHSHRILSYLGLDDLEHEVEKSLRLLRQNLLFPVEHYSYPEGLANSYSEQVIKVLKREGILCSPSAEPGVNRNGDNLFHLKRIMAF
jgi:peptidoglycan/xylan/chitin deacetylase (PgdA/CDA1 family)